MTTIQELAVLRKELEELKDGMRIMLERVETDPLYLEMKGVKHRIETRMDEIEKQVRNEAIMAYAADGNKKRDGVSIKMKTTAEIVDEAATRTWCIDNFTPALKLDTKMIEKAAKDGTIPAELVKITTEPSAYIDSDLSKFLEG